MMSQVIIGTVAVFFAGMGVYGLAAPDALVAPFGVRLDGAEGRTEVRAVYGGFGLAIAALLAASVAVADLRDGAVLAVAVALGGMALGRLVSRLVDRPARFYPIWFFFWVEAVLAGLLLLALRL